MLSTNKDMQREQRRAERLRERGILTILSKSHAQPPLCQLDYKEAYSQMRKEKKKPEIQSNKQKVRQAFTQTNTLLQSLLM